MPFGALAAPPPCHRPTTDCCIRQLEMFVGRGGREAGLESSPVGLHSALPVSRRLSRPERWQAPAAQRFGPPPLASASLGDDCRMRNRRGAARSHRPRLDPELGMRTTSEAESAIPTWTALPYPLSSPPSFPPAAQTNWPRARALVLTTRSARLKDTDHASVSGRLPAWPDSRSDDALLCGWLVLCCNRPKAGKED